MQKIFFVFILIYYCQTLADINRENPTSIRRGSLRVKIKRDNEQKSSKINGILFLADTYPDEEYTNTSGINLLHLEHKVNVKHCTIDNRKCTQTKDSKCHKLPCTCYERLKEAIIGLINYSQTYLDMITALGSISNHSFSNSLRFGSAEIDLNIKTLENFKEPNSYQTKDGCLENKVKNELYQNEVEKTTVNYNRVPLLNVFPKDAPPLDSNMEDDTDKSLYLRGKRKEDGPYIFGSEHTEVFKIRSRRDEIGEPREITDADYLNRKEKPTTIFDLLDILSVIHKSLLGEESGSYGALPLIKPKKKRGIKYDNCRDEEPSWEKTLQKYSHDKSSKMAKSFALVLVETILVVSFGIAVI